MGVGLGVVIAAVLPPADHDAQRGVIYRVPRKKGCNQRAVYGGGWRVTSVFLIKGNLSNCRMRSDDPDGAQPPACPTFWLDKLVEKMPADGSTTRNHNKEPTCRRGEHRRRVNDGHRLIQSPFG